MKIFFYILPFFISILVVITKKKIVNSQSGKSYATREFFIDSFKIAIITLISIIANIVYDKNIPVWLLLIDVIMLVIYLLPFIQKNYNYTERKALGGIWASCIFMALIAVAIFQMLIGTYDKSNPTLSYCFIKGVSYFFIAIWTCFTIGKKNKFKSFFYELSSSFKNNNLSILDYYLFAFWGLFIFTGYNNNFTPVGLFGIHEVLNKKKIKGIIYIITGNLCLFMKYKFPFLGSITYILYTLVAFIDLIINFIKYIKSKKH